MSMETATLTSAMRLLVIEDDAKIASFLVKGLKQARYATDHAVDGDNGITLMQRHRYDLVILNLALSNDNRFKFLTFIRENKMKMPVILYNPESGLEDLLHKVRALLLRNEHKEKANILSVGDLTVDFHKREVWRANKKINLHGREFLLLELLVRHAGKALTKNFILEKVWGYRFDPQTNVVDVLVCRLRAKIDKGFGDELIRTVRGVGYAFDYV